MMGKRQVRQEALFYGFSLEEHVPADHLLRAIDRFVELSDIRWQLEPFGERAWAPTSGMRAGPTSSMHRRI